MNHHFVTAIKLFDNLLLMCESIWITKKECFPTVLMCWIQLSKHLSCGQQGADVQYLKLHVLLQQTFHYYVKHAQGISTEFNQHSNIDPWYGAGQGAGDACLWWIVQADSIKAYESWAEPWILYSPNHDQHYWQLLDAFVDDTDIFAAQQPRQSFLNFVANLQSNINLWHDLLQASGGVLNPSKCVWLCFNWHISSTGCPTIIPPPPSIHLSLTVKGQPPKPYHYLIQHQNIAISECIIQQMVIVTLNLIPSTSTIHKSLALKESSNYAAVSIIRWLHKNFL